MNSTIKQVATLAVTTASICDHADTEAMERGAYSAGYNSSPGALAVLDELCPVGVAFADFWAEALDESDQGKFFFRLLSNLSCEPEDLVDIRGLGEGESYVHTEHWGDEITIEFCRINGEIVATYPGDLRIICA